MSSSDLIKTPKSIEERVLRIEKALLEILAKMDAEESLVYTSKDLYEIMNELIEEVWRE